MRRTSGFTLVEMLVSVALVLFIMVILTEAFGKGLDSFRTLKAIGDMESKLRMAASTLRRDLMADHFEGKRRLSDPNARWVAMEAPREGFFRHATPSRAQIPGNVREGGDSDGLVYLRSANSVLHFTVKLRGNDRSQFFTAKLPPTSPLIGLNPLRSTFFDLPSDARFQETGDFYRSQWAEVAYWLEPTGQVNGGPPLFTLYRTQLLIVADNSKLNWPSLMVQETRFDSNDYDEFSCRPVLGVLPRDPRRFYMNNPTDINSAIVPSDPNHPHRRGFNPFAPSARGASPLLSDVVSFTVTAGDFDNDGNPRRFPDDNANPNVDTHPINQQGIVMRRIQGGITKIGISIRVWDTKSKQTRQMTIVQDL